jgi:hypothetical protein
VSSKLNHSGTQQGGTSIDNWDAETHTAGQQGCIGSDRISLTEYYRPMVLLLDPDELNAARALPHVSKSAFKRFRKQRIAAFRKYLADLQLDFRRLEFKLRFLLLNASASQAGLVHRLNMLKLQFTWNLYVLEFRLVLFSLGIGTLDVSGLLEELESLNQALQPQRSQTASA